MSTTTATKKYAYLRMVTVENNNKMYEMVDNEDGTFTAFWGRMTGNHEDDKKSAQSKVYAMGEWDSKFNSKVKKGYEDSTKYRAVTTLVETKKANGASIISNDQHVATIIAALQAYAKAQTAAVYKVEAVGVTQEMIDDAQVQVDKLSNILKGYKDTPSILNLFNADLLKLFSIIPRRMAQVKEHLGDEKMGHKQLLALVEQEQSNIDSMAGQVAQNKAMNTAPDDNTTKASATLLDTLGLEMELVTDQKTIDMVRKKAEEHAKRVLKIFKVKNKVTQKAYDAQLASAHDKKVDLMWHGSRNQNWWFIVQQGLRIRPSGAGYNGSMFGDGIYFASECDKSMGYTDSGRWARGNSNGRVYMALYAVHLGKQYCIQRSDGSLNAKKLDSMGGYNSTWGQKGPSLYRHEYIVYQSSQCTIQYLVEFQD